MDWHKGLVVVIAMLAAGGAYWQALIMAAVVAQGWRGGTQQAEEDNP